MQLDRTHVAIRVRTLSEIGDLSLLMIRRYPQAFFHAFFLGAAFWIVADLLLLGWLPLTFADPTLLDSESDEELVRYVFWMTTLVFLQAPIAGVLTTYTLGQSIFEHQPTVRKAVREVRSLLWPLVWTLGIKRLAIPAMVVVALRWQQEVEPITDFLVPISFMLVAALIRSNRPFLPEMILLERCPLRSKDESAITLKRRSKALHSPMASELGGRFLTVSMTLTALLTCVFFALVWTRGITFGNWAADRFAMLVFFPLSLWLIASLSVVVRLLGYLDARIRLEGWEVELAIRAEAIRQFGEDFMSAPPRSVQRHAAPTSPRSNVGGNVDASVTPPPIEAPVVAPLTPPPESTQPTESEALPPDSMSNTPSPTAPGSKTTLGLAWFLATLSITGLAGSHTASASSQFGVSSQTAEFSQSVGTSQFAVLQRIAIAEPPIVADSVWFDAEQGTIRPIELEDTHDDTLNRESRWLPKPAKPAVTPANQPTTTTTGTNSWWGNISVWNIIGWLLLMVLIGGLVALLMYLFANGSFDFRPDTLAQSVVHSKTLDEQTKQRIAELPAELRDTNTNPRSELERLMNSGDFDRAIIFLYGHQLLMLDRAGYLRLSRWKTNSQYVRETAQSNGDIGGHLKLTVGAFERSYFGKHRLSREEFERLWRDNLQIERSLAANVGAKS